MARRALRSLTILALSPDYLGLSPDRAALAGGMDAFADALGGAENWRKMDESATRGGQKAGTKLAIQGNRGGTGWLTKSTTRNKKKRKREQGTITARWAHARPPHQPRRLDLEIVRDSPEIVPR